VWGFLLSFAVLTDYQIAGFALLAALLAAGGRLRRGGRLPALPSIALALALPAATVGWLVVHLRAAGYTPAAGGDAAAALAFHVHLVDFFSRPHPGLTPDGAVACCATGAGVAGPELMAYPGGLPLVGSLVALAASLRSTSVARTAGVWLVVGLLCAALALGPTLTLDAHSTVRVGASPVLLPYALLLVSGAADLVREPARFILPMTIALVTAAALAAEVGLAAAVRTDRSRRGGRAPAVRWRWAVLAAAALVIAGSIVESWPQPFVTADLVPFQTDPALHALGGLPAGNVLTLPTARLTGQWHIGCSYSGLEDALAAVTGHAMVGGYLSRGPV
jgi:hypothetical protein